MIWNENTAVLVIGVEFAVDRCPLIYVFKPVWRIAIKLASKVYFIFTDDFNYTIRYSRRRNCKYGGVE